MLRRDDRRIVVQGRRRGGVHFNAAFRNASLLRRGARGARGTASWRALAAEETPRILALYEELFDHQSFTGRSGTFYNYEGLGCIYWHMVSKLLLAVQEVCAPARRAPRRPRSCAGSRSTTTRSARASASTRPPTEYGAFPTDPYSHTPGFAGVQQPGMTGQVKEDILSRFGEMGASVDAGRLVFRADLFRGDELLKTAGTLRVHRPRGTSRRGSSFRRARSPSRPARCRSWSIAPARLASS